MRVTTWAVALFFGVALALPLAAQEDPTPKELPPAPSAPPAETPDTDESPAAPVETPAPKRKLEFGDPPLHRWGGITVSLAAWEPNLVGADEAVASTYLNGYEEPLMQGNEPRIRQTVVATYHLPKDAGSIALFYDSMNQFDAERHLSPGDFIYAETRAFPFSAGAFDDGFADGVTASLDRKTREFRLSYSRAAFQNAKAKGTWSIGYRLLSHSRNLDITYLAIVPNLPPLIPPRVGGNVDPARLNPLPDRVVQTANFSGHGLGAGFDLEFPVQQRVSIITGLSIGLIRGTSRSAYLSQTSFYYQEPNREVPLTREQLFEIMDNGSEQDILRVGQQLVNAGFRQAPTPQLAQSLDIYVGLEVKLYKGLKVFGTLRNVFYSNLGDSVVPRPDFGEQRTALSAGYEGYALGLSWRY